MLAIMFLYTGLFITAHDAMHRTLMPRDPLWNNILGRIVVFIFALFSYAKLLEKHREHHEHPATMEDPDYHNGKHAGFIAWYGHFMTEYMTWTQLLGMGTVFCILWLVFGADPQNVFLFGLFPRSSAHYSFSPSGLICLTESHVEVTIMFIERAAMITLAGFLSSPAITSAIISNTTNSLMFPGGS